MKSLPPFLGMLLMLAACVNDGDFDVAESNCSSNVQANATFSQVKNLYQGELLQIQEDWVIEGYIVSSDRAGNFFSALYFQDNPTNPTEGFQIEIDVRDNHLLFPIGSKILVKLKGLYLGQSKGVFSIGGTFAAFGTTSVGRLPALKVPEHVFVSCDEPIEILPLEVSIPALDVSLTNTLVRFQNLEISEQELDSTFAVERKETERTLLDCSDNELTLLNSGFADFQAEPLPQGNGAITGVLFRENEDYFLAIRDLNDINFVNDRCEEVITEFTSNQLFFSELADPNNNAGARFVELYNAASEPLDLNGWTLNRYTNANTEVSSTIDLSGLTIAAESTLVISPNADEFELVYGFAPNLAVGTNSPADSNGDDNLVLVDPFGKVIDVFGVVGEDGSGTNHEFEDGKAVRNSEISEGNPAYTFSEWIIFNDTGDSGTTNQPQNAPDDFTPGFRN
jgi:hypothetical protein